MRTVWKAGPALYSTVCLLMLAHPADAQPTPDSEGRYARACQDLDERWTNGDKNVFPQGTMLWGSARRVEKDEVSAALVTVKTQGARMGNPPIEGVRLSGGHLVPISKSTRPAATPNSLWGVVLHGTDYDGKPMDVAICTAEPTPGDPDMTWYRIQVWNELTDTWQNPCVGTKDLPHPRALAVQGTWDAQGAHHDSNDEFTFACDTGVIAKCATWGYKPWAKGGAQSSVALHQACTRMARADYCGDGHSHTKDGTNIDVYDRLNILHLTDEPTSKWNPALASFEAAWGTDGAVCLARTRLGQPLDEILKECPDRFEAGRDVDLGGGDRCRIGVKTTRAATPLLRNRSYAPDAVTAGGGNP